jgi:hypothetical protein
MREENHSFVILVLCKEERDGEREREREREGERGRERVTEIRKKLWFVRF